MKIRRKQTAYSVDEMIELAKKSIGKTYGGGERSWLEAEPTHSYSDPTYRVRLFVWEGSPPKGYIIASYSDKMVTALGVRMQHIHTWHELDLYL